MGLFSDWTSVASSFALQEGQGVRCIVAFTTVPLTAPNQEEWTRAVENNCDVRVSRVDTQSSGAAIYANTEIPITAGELRGEFQAAVADLNANRSVPLLYSIVGEIEVADSEAPGNGGGNLPWLGVGMGAVLGLALLVVAAAWVLKGR